MLMSRNIEYLDGYALGATATSLVIDLASRVGNSEALELGSDGAWLFAGILACSALGARVLHIDSLDKQ